MRRTNTFTVRPCTEQDKQLLHELLDASASLWNELTYERRQNYFEGESIWETDDYRKRYVGVLGSATAQQLIRKSKSAWNSFFSLKEKGKYANPPSYWGNEDDGRTLRTYIRNDQYTLKMGDRSRLEIPVGTELKAKYGHTGWLRLEATGVPKWDDLTASETFLRRQTNVPRPMAWPVCLKWDDHSWSESPHSHRPNEEHTHQSIRYLSEKVAHVGGRHD